jgi:hypothetical protein
MASETTIASKATPATTPMDEAFLRRLLPETIPPATTGNPVDVIPALRKDMAEFQKASGGNKQDFKKDLRAAMRAALREELREELRAACKKVVLHAGESPGTGDSPGTGGNTTATAGAGCPGGAARIDIGPIVEYLTGRGVITPKLSRAQIRRLGKSVLREMEAKKGPSERNGQ